nr:receptor-like protein 12 [Ipomoea batatas]
MQEALESVEGRALLQWKKTLFDTDGVLDSWSHSNLKNLCNNWTGITCNATTATTYVSEINVRDYSNRLTAIANLSKLTVLDLSYNGFQTSIPLGITMLTKLRYLKHSDFISFPEAQPDQFQKGRLPKLSLSPKF